MTYRGQATGKHFTKKACEGCGKENSREVGKLCYECQTLIKEAQEARGRQNAELDLVYGMRPEYFHYMGHTHAGGARDRIKYAVSDLVKALTVLETNKQKGYRSGREEITLAPSQYKGLFENLISVLMRKEHALMIAKLDTLIREFAEDEYQAGLREGSSILSKLTTGELTYKEVDEFMENRELKVK